MKKVISVLLSLIFLIPATTVFGFAEDMSHTHTGTLRNIMTENVDGIEFCGEFFCNECGETYYAPVTHSDLGMPIINLEGDTSEMTKENEVPLVVTYSSDTVNFTSNASFKWQGGSSTAYEKKNYTMKLLNEDGSKNKVKIVDTWGKQSKYCLKANWIDASHSRNIVSARIFGDIVRSRCLDDELETLPNAGAVDGFPVALYQNGEFYGLYTLNIPKDNWAWGMNDPNTRQALLFAGAWTNAVRLRAVIDDVNDPAADGFDIEYCSTEDDPEVGTAWVAESFNTFILMINKSMTADRFKSMIETYTSVDRAIDVMIFTYFLHADDNMAKNIVWATYDGVKWIPCMYDMDATWGLFWDGSLNISPKGMYFGGANALFEKILKYYPDEVEARFEELRGDILSKKSIEKYFTEFFNSVSDVVRRADAEKWPAVPSRSNNNYTTIYNFATQRIADFDNHYALTVRELTRYGNKVFFDVQSGCKFYAYPYEDYTVEPTRCSAVVPTDATGTIVKRNNEANFLIVPPEGYVVDTVTVKNETGYESLVGPEVTGKENVYRVSGVTDFIDIGVTVREIPAGYNVTFETDGLCEVLVYPSSDLTETPENTLTALTIDSSTGLPTRSGDGQVNFKLVPTKGYKIDTVTVSPKAYKNLKGPEDLGTENTYRITKITGDIVVCVTVTEDTSVPTYILGDANGDDSVNAIDANLLKKHLGGSYTLSDTALLAADVNKDDNVNAIDANLLKKFLSGAIDVLG